MDSYQKLEWNMIMNLFTSTLWNTQTHLFFLSFFLLRLSEIFDCFYNPLKIVWRFLLNRNSVDDLVLSDILNIWIVTRITQFSWNSILDKKSKGWLIFQCTPLAYPLTLLHWHKLVLIKHKLMANLTPYNDLISYY